LVTTADSERTEAEAARANCGFDSSILELYGRAVGHAEGRRWALPVTVVFSGKDQLRDVEEIMEQTGTLRSRIA
jgi:hypothetical protein